MSLVINGKKYNLICLNGKEYSRGYFNGRLVLNVPDNNAYLWAGPGVRLAADDKTAVSYLNTPQIVQDDLSGTDIGLADFRFEFDVHKDAVETGTAYLVNLPGIVHVKSEAEALAFKFPWETRPVWKFAPESALAAGWNRVALQKQNNLLAITVNGVPYSLVDYTAGAAVKNKIYRGFSTERYIWAEQDSNADTIFISVLPKQVTSYNYQYLLSWGSNGKYVLYMDSSGELKYVEKSDSFPSGITYATGLKLQEGVRSWVKLYRKNGVHVAIAPDDNTLTLEKLASGMDGLAWAEHKLYSTSYNLLADWPAGFFRVGYGTSSSYVWRGGVDMAKAGTVAQNQLILDGRNETYNVMQPSSSEWNIETWQNKPNMPQLRAGALSVTPGWMKIKNVKATLL